MAGNASTPLDVILELSAQIVTSVRAALPGESLPATLIALAVRGDERTARAALVHAAFPPGSVLELAGIAVAGPAWPHEVLTSYATRATPERRSASPRTRRVRPRWSTSRCSRSLGRQRETALRARHCRTLPCVASREGLPGRLQNVLSTAEWYVRCSVARREDLTPAIFEASSFDMEREGVSVVARNTSYPGTVRIANARRRRRSGVLVGRPQPRP